MMLGGDRIHKHQFQLRYQQQLSSRCSNPYLLCLLHSISVGIYPDAITCLIYLIHYAPVFISCYTGFSARLSS